MSNTLQILMPAHNEGKNIQNHIIKGNNILKKKIILNEADRFIKQNTI